jgi:uncharacterized membrane protein
VPKGAAAGMLGGAREAGPVMSWRVRIFQRPVKESPAGDGATAHGDAALGADPSGAPRRTGERGAASGYPLARAGRMEYDRVVFFSDAVFAIAITLLIVDLRVPEAVGSVTIQSGHTLDKSISQIVGFFISFIVIGIFWLAHHTIFRYVEAFDRVLIVLNLLFLGTIAFLPYPTELLFSSSTKQAAGVIFYAVCCAAAGLAEAAVWMWATQPSARLAPQVSPLFRRNFLARILPAPVMFVLSIPLAIFASKWAVYSWALIFIVGRVVDWAFPLGKILPESAN